MGGTQTPVTAFVLLLIIAAMMKLKQAAKELSISERFLRQLISENRIPFYRLSKRTLRVDLKELRDCMKLIAQGKPNGEDVDDVH